MEVLFESVQNPMNSILSSFNFSLFSDIHVFTSQMLT